MMPRKKLEFYAAKHGIEDFAAVRMTEEEISAVCTEVGSSQFGIPDCGGKISTLIDCITDDLVFKELVKGRLSAKGDEVSEDFLAIRMADYAADAVMGAYQKVRGKA